MIGDDVMREAVGKATGSSDEDDIQILGQDVSLATNPGENFTSVVGNLRISASLTNKSGKNNADYKTFDFIVKHAPPQALQFMKMSGMFERECLAYQVIIPQLQKIAQSISLRLPFADSYYGNPDKLTLIMSNLKLAGYELVEKSKGLDMDHLKVVFKRLSQLHAVSYHHLQTYEKGGVEGFKRDTPLLTNEEWMKVGDTDFARTEIYEPAVRRALLILENVIKTEESVRLAGKIRTYMDQDLSKAMIGYLNPQDDGFRVICHGDCWSNNFLFKHDDSEAVPIEVALVDLQFMRYGPPCADLWYCLTSATSFQWRTENMDALLKLYHDDLSAYLNQLGYDANAVFPYRAFRNQFDSCYGIGFIMGNFLSVIVKQDSDNLIFDSKQNMLDRQFPDFRERIENREIEGCKNSKAIQDRILDLALEAEERGLIA